jgi:5-methylcytosine-specific restriction protein A
MPWASPTVCVQQGCANLVAKPGYCQAHQRVVYREYNQARAAKNLESDKAYHTAAWRKLRLSVLNAEPLCRKCRSMSKVTPAYLVDHIVPVKQGGEFWDRENLQPLCNDCHEIKSNAEGSRRSAARR